MSFIYCNVRRKINHRKLAPIWLLSRGKKGEVNPVSAESEHWWIQKHRKQRSALARESPWKAGNGPCLQKMGINGAYSERPSTAIWHQRSRRERPPKQVPDKQTVFATSFLSESRESVRTMDPRIRPSTTTQEPTLHASLGRAGRPCWGRPWGPAQHPNKGTRESNHREAMQGWTRWQIFCQ